MGVCYGRNGNNLLSPPQVVDLYKRRNIRRMRTYDPDHAILDALRGSGIELNVAITNQYLQYLAASQSNADDWVRDHVNNYPDVNFKYISVGNEVSPANGDTSRYAQFVLPAMTNVYRAVCSCRGGRIKTTTSLGMDVIGNSFPPQDGAFRDDVKPFLRPILSFLSNTGSPLMMNIYPYFAYIYNQDQIDLGYALLEPDHGIEVNGVYYDNILYAMVDAVYAAVDRVIGPSYNGRQTPTDVLSQSAAADYNHTRCHRPKVNIADSHSGWPAGPPRGGEDVRNEKSGRSKRETRGGNETSTYLQRSARGRSKPKVVVSESGWPTRGSNPGSPQNAQKYNRNLIDVVADGTPARPDEAIEAYIFALFDENEKPGAEIERNFGLFYPNGQPKYDLNFN